MSDVSDDESDLPETTPQPGGVELAPRVRVPTSALRFRFVRARGPGGQNVNKVSTACELRLWMSDLAPILTVAAFARLRTALGSRLTAAGEVQIVSDEHRSQEQNRDAVLGRLRELLVRAMIEPKHRKATKPSRGSKRRRVEGKRLRSQVKKGRGKGGFDD